MLTVGSLFSGIGGIDLGLERAGMTVIWQSETDPYASKVLAKHWPDVPNLGDVTKVDWSHVERPDLIAGGFPCQPVSVAGRGLAQLDTRWLWPAFADCVRSLRPGHVIVENVPGLLVRGMGDVLGDLASLGYDAEWQGIPAAAVGAHHLRWRIFVVADADSVRCHWRLPPEPSSGAGVSAASQGHGPSLAHADGQARECSRSAGQPVFGPETLERLGRRGSSLGNAWAVEPELGRVAHGIPSRLDRLRCLGNAVVPQVAEYVGRQLLAHIDAEPQIGAGR
jgi:DNA (cytosine-5)-methyltransferase 1